MIGAALEAANVMTGLRREGLDPEKLMPLYAEDQLIHLIQTVDFAAQTQFRRGPQAAQVIDYFAANFVPKKYRIKADRTIGRESCWERECQFVENLVVGR